MRSTITLLIGLSTVLLFLSIYGIPYVNGQASNANNKTSNGNSVSQTENLDPFLKGSDNNINTGSANNPSQADDGSTNKNNNDGSTNKNNNDGSSSNNNDDNKKGSDNSKSSEENKDSKSKDNGKKFE